MINVQRQPEPADFDEKVRKPGLKYLKLAGKTGKIDWKSPKATVWRNCRNELYAAYKGLCCYVAMHISPSTVNKNDLYSASVEHFIPKSQRPELAYEWSNYRLASRKANSDRQTKSVLDPFLVKNDWFELELFSGEVNPNPTLPKNLLSKVINTINNLNLNDYHWKKLRVKYFANYNLAIKNANTEEEVLIAQKYLKEFAPIVYQAMIKQGIL